MDSYTYKGASDYAARLKKGKIAKPSTLDKSKHDEKYFLRWCEYAHGSYCGDQLGVLYGGLQRNKRSILELRNYARGVQDPMKYRNQLDPLENGKGFYNIGWDNVQLMPKFRDIIKGKLLNIDFSIGTQVIDEVGKSDKDDLIAKMKFHQTDAAKQLRSSIGIKVKQGEEVEGASTPEDIDLLDQIGLIQLGAEIMLKDAIDGTLHVSDYDQLKDMLIDDLIDANKMICKEYVDEEDNAVKIKYIDIARAFYQQSIYPDKKDISMAGHYETKTLAEIREETGWDESKIWMIAKKYEQENGAAGVERSNFRDRSWRESYYDQYGTFPYDKFRIDVMELSFVAGVAEQFITGNHHKLGNQIFDEVSLGATLSDRDKRRKKKMVVIEKQCVYKVKWVVGTKFIYDFGKEYAGVHEGQRKKMRGKVPYIIIEGNGPSIVERCIPAIDDLQLATLKLRNIVSKVPPGPRIVIDTERFHPYTKIAGKEYNVFEMADIFTKTGVLALKGKKGTYGENVNSSQSKPWEFMSSGIMEDVNLFRSEFDSAVETLRMVTGINEVADGSSVNPDMLKGTMEGLQASTNNALKPLFSIYERFKLNLVQHAAKKWRLAVLAGDISLKYKVGSSMQIKNVKITKEIFQYELGVVLVTMPTEEERQLLMQDLMVKEKEGQITVDAKFAIQNMIRNGDIKKAELFLARAVQDKMAMDQEAASRNIQEQAEANAVAGERVEAAKMAKEEAMTRREQMKIERQLEADIKRDNNQHRNTLEALDKTESLRERLPAAN